MVCDIVLSVLSCSNLQILDPLHGIRRPSTAPSRKSKDNIADNPEKSEKLMRERSIRTNRKHKFVDCLSSQDVNIGEQTRPTLEYVSVNPSN